MSFDRARPIEADGVGRRGGATELAVRVEPDAVAVVVWTQRRLRPAELRPRIAPQIASTITAPRIEPMIPLGRMLKPVADEQAEDQPADERADQPGDERLGPVARAPAQQQLGEPAGEEPEADDGEDEHGRRG